MGRLRLLQHQSPLCQNVLKTSKNSKNSLPPPLHLSYTHLSAPPLILAPPPRSGTFSTPPCVQPIAGAVCGSGPSLPANAGNPCCPGPASARHSCRKMAAAAELTLLEKSLGLSKGNKYSAQGERQVRSGAAWRGRGGIRAGPLNPGKMGRPAEAENAALLPTCLRRRAGWLASLGLLRPWLLRVSGVSALFRRCLNFSSWEIVVCFRKARRALREPLGRCEDPVFGFSDSTYCNIGFHSVSSGYSRELTGCQVALCWDWGMQQWLRRRTHSFLPGTLALTWVDKDCCYFNYSKWRMLHWSRDGWESTYLVLAQCGRFKGGFSEFRFSVRRAENEGEG